MLSGMLGAHIQSVPALLSLFLWSWEVLVHLSLSFDLS